MENRFYLNTRLLRDHVSEVQDERRTAQRLKEAVRMTRDLGNPAAAGQYRRILESVDSLEGYFGRMANALETISDKGYQMYTRIGRMIEDDTDRTRSENNKRFML